MICIKTHKNDSKIMQSTINLDVTDEDGNPMTGIRSIDVHLGAGEIITADVVMFCSGLDICAADRILKICPIFNRSVDEIDAILAEKEGADEI